MYNIGARAYVCMFLYACRLHNCACIQSHKRQGGISEQPFDTFSVRIIRRFESITHENTQKEHKGSNQEKKQ